MNTDHIHQQKIILFDGVCSLCSNAVVFILQHESKPVFKFASIQSEIGKELLRWCGLPADYSEAVVLLDKGKRYLGSTARSANIAIRGSEKATLVWLQQQN